jgi:hypothetical protein
MMSCREIAENEVVSKSVYLKSRFENVRQEYVIAFRSWHDSNTRESERSEQNKRRGEDEVELLSAAELL